MVQNFFKKILASCLQINIFIAVDIYAKISQPISAGVRRCALTTGYLLLAFSGQRSANLGKVAIALKRTGLYGYV